MGKVRGDSQQKEERKKNQVSGNNRYGGTN